MASLGEVKKTEHDVEMKDEFSEIRWDQSLVTRRLITMKGTPS